MGDCGSRGFSAVSARGSPPLSSPHIVIWQQLIQKHGGVLTGSLDISALAKVSDGYSQGSLVQAVQAVLGERRLLQLPKRPLAAAEFLQMLARAEPIYPEEEEMLQVPWAPLPAPPLLCSGLSSQPLPPQD